MKTTIKKRAFVSAIAMLIVSAIVLTSSTFAWFSMSKQATVESMDLTVSSPEGIQISTNASGWTASLTVDNIFNTVKNNEAHRYDAYEGNNNLYPADLIPVSSAFGAANASGYVNFFKAVLDKDNNASISAVSQLKDDQNTAGLIAFDLFFKVAKTTTVYFDKTVFTDNSNSNILSTLRMAFTPLGNAASADATTAQAWNTFTKESTTYFEVNSTLRSADATERGIGATAQSTSPLYTGTAGSATVGTDNNGVVTSSNYVTGLGVPSANRFNESSDSMYFTLNTGVTKMRVYIWVEGQDIDCTNSVSGASLTAALKFTID